MTHPYFLTSFVGNFSFLTLINFLSPPRALGFAPTLPQATSKILADNGYENSATNYEKVVLNLLLLLSQSSRAKNNVISLATHSLIAADYWGLTAGSPWPKYWG